MAKEKRETNKKILNLESEILLIRKEERWPYKGRSRYRWKTFCKTERVRYVWKNNYFCYHFVLSSISKEPVILLIPIRCSLCRPDDPPPILEWLRKRYISKTFPLSCLILLVRSAWLGKKAVSAWNQGRSQDFSWGGLSPRKFLTYPPLPPK